MNALKVSELCSKYTSGNKYLLFSIADTWYLMIVEKGNRYEEYYVIKDGLEAFMLKKRTIRGNNKVLDKAFNKDIYHQGFIDLNSPFYSEGYKASSGNKTYFYFKDINGDIHGESLLTTIINPNPIDTEVYNFLLYQLLRFIK